MDIQIRWMMRLDIPEVLEIEGQRFEFTWSKEDFLRHLRQRNCIGMVAEYHERIVGYMIYKLHKHRIWVEKFVVHSQCRSQGIGTAMVDKLITKMTIQKRNAILLEVPETNLAAQLFFRSQGFRATEVLRGYYEDSAEDAYQMEYMLRDIENPFSPVNRVNEFLQVRGE